MSLVELIMAQTETQETELLGRAFLGNCRGCVTLSCLLRRPTLNSFYIKFDNSNLVAPVRNHIPMMPMT